MNGKHKRDQRPYVAMLKEDINRPEYSDLSSNAKAIYTLLKVKFNPKKNGGLVRLPYREVRKKEWRGLRSFDSISAALQELELKGWIGRSDPGGLPQKVTWYRLTRKFDHFRTVANG